MIRSFKYRIYPTTRQENVLNEHLAVCCELYNAALQERRDAWKLNKKSISRFDQILQLPDIRRERPEIEAVNAQVLEDVITRVDRTFQAFFRRVKQSEHPGYPRFRSIRRYNSLTFRDHAARTALRDKLRVSKVGNIRIKLHRPCEGLIKTLTIKQEAGRWFVIFQTECEPAPLPTSDIAVGIDVGITAFATFSDGSAIANPRYYKESQKELRIAQRRLARRKKGSNRTKKAVRLLQRAHIYVRNQRADFHHKLSRVVVNNFGLIAVEDLNVKGLARMNLAKQVNDAGWSSFIDKLSYKAENAGRLLIKVNPSGTSQTCICGARVAKTLADRWHQCDACGLSAPRDHVSAQIILGRGLRLQALTDSLEAVA